MELRTTEQEVHEMVITYESLRHWDRGNNLLPPLELKGGNQPAKSIVLENEETQFQQFSNEKEVLQSLESIHDKCLTLEAKMKKFQERLGEKDPITEAPRYGAKTAERVSQLLSLYEALRQVVWPAFGMKLEQEAESNADNAETTPQENLDNNIASKLRERIAQQEQSAREAELEAQRKQQEEEARQKAEEEAQQQAEEERRRAEEAELSRRVEEARQAQRQAEEAAAQEERDWVNSIPKGPNGVRQQISSLKESTANDPMAQKNALTALLQLFTQIVKHPEEINFRRIRRDHPKFNEDIGRHSGGKEILIAAGFRLATLDEVPCYFSKEPDLESDMDKWSAWFDNLKATLEVVKEMQ